MAEKRMFNKKITDSDAFLSMPASSQALYFHLNMHADDDGFVNNPKVLTRMVGASEDDLKLLIIKRFVITFDEKGILVIKHWKVHNTIKSDRYHPTEYQEEFKLLGLKENDKSYTVLDTRFQLGSNLETENRIDKNRLDLDKNSNKRHQYGEYNNVLFTDDQFEKLKEEFPTTYNDWIERLSSYMASTGKSYKNHLATIRNWAKKNNESKVEVSYDTEKVKAKAQGPIEYKPKNKKEIF